MATINSLANETLYNIMERLKAPSLPLWDTGSSFPLGSYNDLRAAALVCSRWRDPAQRALFDSVLLHTNDRLLKQKLLTSPARPRYRTRSMDVGGPATSSWLNVARSTQGLERLSLRLSKQFHGPWWSWELIAHSCLAGLKHPSILYPEDFDDPVGPPPILNMRLESLSLWLYDIRPASPALIIAALFAASSASLAYLHLRLYDQRSERSIIPSFHLVAANLRTLILESTHNVLEGHLDLLSACTSLEHLVLKWDKHEYGYDTWGRHNMNPLYIPAILAALPSTPTLRHLSLGFNEPLDLVPIANLSKHPALEFLAKLDLPRMALRGGEDTPDKPRRKLEDAVVQALLSMKATCEHRGIVCRGPYSR